MVHTHLVHDARCYFEYKDNFFINGSNEFYSNVQCFIAVRVNNFTIDKSRMRLYFTDYL